MHFILQNYNSIETTFKQKIVIMKIAACNPPQRELVQAWTFALSGKPYKNCSVRNAKGTFS